jgi:hypothetical protein
MRRHPYRRQGFPGRERSLDHIGPRCLRAIVKDDFLDKACREVGKWDGDETIGRLLLPKDVAAVDAIPGRHVASHHAPLNRDR